MGGQACSFVPQGPAWNLGSPELAWHWGPQEKFWRQSLKECTCSQGLLDLGWAWYWSRSGTSVYKGCFDPGNLWDGTRNWVFTAKSHAYVTFFSSWEGFGMERISLSPMLHMLRGRMTWAGLNSSLCLQFVFCFCALLWYMVSHLKVSSFEGIFTCGWSFISVFLGGGIG